MINQREKVIAYLIKQEVNDAVGGYENSVADGHIETMPSRESIMDDVYYQVMNAKVVDTPMGAIRVEKDIRFLGTVRIKEMIAVRVNKVMDR